MLDRLPPQLQQHLFLEWLSPEAVWTLVRSSGETRRAVLSAASSLSPGVEFRAAEEEVLSEMCVRWFREQGLTLRLWTTVKTTRQQETFFYSNGQLHRDDDLPAVVRFFSGEEEWWRHGKRHREGDLAAVVWHDGTQFWYKDGKLHRDGDLAAEVWQDGTQFWYQHGMCHRDGDLPAEIWGNGTQRWYQNGLCHRDGDQPAAIYADGMQAWYQNGTLHRDSGKPAVLRVDGSREWWTHDRRVSRLCCTVRRWWS